MYLTSGIRGVVKQFLLYLDKADNNHGNLSLASRSLAPPGYSYHGIADFDVGQIGYGILNFTGRFTTTEVFKNKFLFSIKTIYMVSAYLSLTLT